MHKFEIANRRYLFDENSNSLHEIDDLVWDLLNVTDLAQIEVLRQKYPWEDVDEALDELQELVAAGQLVHEPLPEPKMPVGEPMVKALCLHLAHDCNLRCVYCFAGTGPFGGCRELMSPEVGKAALDLLISSSGSRRNLEVDFFGGEPLLNFQVVKDLVQYGRELEAKHNKVFRFTLTTNATLLTEEVREFLNEEKIAVVLSLDGRKEVNDNARPYVDGEGSYQHIVPDMLEFVAARGHDNYYVRGTFTRHNLDFAADVQHMAELGFKHLSLEPVVGAPEMDYTLKLDDLPKLEAEYERLAEYYIERHLAGKPFTFFHFNLSLDHGPCLIKQVTGCGAGYDYLAVTPSGELYPCHQFVGVEKFKMGDVFSGIKEKAISYDFQKVNLYQKEACANCWARFFCSGGCMAHAYFANGDFNKPEPLACSLQKKRLECALHVQAQTTLRK